MKTTNARWKFLRRSTLTAETQRVRTAAFIRAAVACSVRRAGDLARFKQRLQAREPLAAESPAALRNSKCPLRGHAVGRAVAPDSTG